MEIVRTETGGASINFDYRATKKSIVVPKIVESYVDDDDIVQHILESGDTMSALRYEATYGKLIIPGEIKPKGHKGDNPDGRKIKF